MEKQNKPYNKALAIAKKYWRRRNIETMAKHLAEEVFEIGIAMGAKDPHNFREEVGDAALVLMELWRRLGEDDSTIIELALEAAIKRKNR